MTWTLPRSRYDPPVLAQHPGRHGDRLAVSRRAREVLHARVGMFAPRDELVERHLLRRAPVRRERAAPRARRSRAAPARPAPRRPRRRPRPSSARTSRPFRFDEPTRPCHLSRTFATGSVPGVMGKLIVSRSLADDAVGRPADRVLRVERLDDAVGRIVARRHSRHADGGFAGVQDRLELGPHVAASGPGRPARRRWPSRPGRPPPARARGRGSLCFPSRRHARDRIGRLPRPAGLNTTNTDPLGSNAIGMRVTPRACS